MSDDFDIHFQTICLPLTLHSMRLALSLLAFSSLTASQNIPDAWSSAFNVSDDNKQLLISTLGHTAFFANNEDIFVCVKDTSSLCTQATNYLFGIKGCAVSEVVGACSAATLQSCTSSYFLVQIGDQPWSATPVVTYFYSVSYNDVLPGSCDFKANLVQCTQYIGCICYFGEA